MYDTAYYSRHEDRTSRKSENGRGGYSDQSCQRQQSWRVIPGEKNCARKSRKVPIEYNTTMKSCHAGFAVRAYYEPFECEHQ